MNSIEVQVPDGVLDFLRRLPPEPRHRLREAIRSLREEKGDTKALDGKLIGYHRLRVGSYRVIYIYAVDHGRRLIRCLFAEHRSTIYDLFIETMADRLREKRAGEPDIEAKPVAAPKPYVIPRKPRKKRSGSKAGTASPPRSARTKSARRSPA